MDDIEPIAGFPNKRTMLEVLYVQEGLTIKTIAIRVGAATATVERWMRLLDIPRRSRGGRNSPATLGWKMHRIDPRVIHRLSIREISRLVQISEGYCYKFKKGQGVIWTSRSLVLPQVSNDTQL